MLSKKYRADIDGLRAIAVLCVVVYHAFPGRLPGGFIGVDVFFVISGFLISQILLAELNAATFSIISFYARRVRRIFPALLVVLSACLTFGYTRLFTDELRMLGKHAAGSAAFVANLIQWSEAGYYDSQAPTKPLLHLWSLGVEEQFYIFWPLLLAIGARTRATFVLVVLALLASFAWNLSGFPDTPTASFYSPFARVWELALGGLVAYAGPRWPCRANVYHAASIIGAALIAAGLMMINPTRDFPGWWALLPVLGSVMIIGAGPYALVNRCVLSLRPLVWIGLISYPLYLWHWPLLSFSYIEFSGIAPREVRASIVLASFLLAWLTYVAVERPIRFNKKRATIAMLAGAMCLVTAASSSLMSLSGDEHGIRASGRDAFVSKVRADANAYTDDLDGMRDECNYYNIAAYREGAPTKAPLPSIGPGCTARDPARKAIFVWGDSHAAHLASGLLASLPAKWQLLQVTSSGCVPSAKVDAASKNDFCAQSNFAALSAIAGTRPEVVVLAHNQYQEASRFDSIASRLRTLGVQTVIAVGPVPHWTADLPKILARNYWPNLPERNWIGMERESFEDDALLSRAAAGKDWVYVSPMSLLCDAAGCLTRIGNDPVRDITSWDYGHLMPGASKYVAQSLIVPLLASRVAAGL